jgi:hypothetical protein
MSACTGTRRSFPDADNDGDEQQLHQPVAGMQRGQPPRYVLADHGTQQQYDGEPDLQRESEEHRVGHAVIPMPAASPAATTRCLATSTASSQGGMSAGALLNFSSCLPRAA